MANITLKSSDAENSDGIDADATFIFRQSHNQTTTKTVLEKGKTLLRPQLESICSFDIEYSANEDNECNKEFNKVFSQIASQRVEHKLGSAESKVMNVLEKLLMTMTEGEVSTVNISLCNEFDKVSIDLKLTLYTFTSVKPIWGLTSQEKYNLALSYKQVGTDLFKYGNIEAAFLQYSVAIKYLICMPEGSVSNKQEKTLTEEHNALKNICYLNIAACHSKIANHASVISSCTKALAIDAHSAKGLYRRAQAYKAMGQIEEARSDLKQALEIEPENKAIKNLLLSYAPSMQKTIASYLQHTKAAFSR